MSDSYAEIEQMLLNAVASMEKSSLQIQNQISYFNSLSDLIQADGNSEANGVLVNIGTEIWAQKSKEDALSFIERRRAALQEQLALLAARVTSAKKTIAEFESFKSLQEPNESNQNDENDNGDLAVVDIQELLDEEDNVVSAKVNDKDFMPEIANAETNRTIDSSSTTILSPQQISALQEKPISKFNSTGPSEAIDEEIHSEEVRERPFSKDSASLTNDRPNNSENPEGRARQLDNIYELEMIANEFDSGDENEIENDEEDEYVDNYGEVNDEDDDDDESEDGEDLFYKATSSLFPQNKRIQERFALEIIARRAGLQNGNNSTSNKNRQKEVRFKDTLDIKEVENISEDLKKIEHKKNAVLRFKENRILAHGAKSNQFEKAEETDDKVNEIDPVDVMTDVMERTSFPEDLHAKPSKSEALLADPIAKNAEANQTAQEDQSIQSLQDELARESKREKTSRFKKMLAQNPKRNNHYSKPASLIEHPKSEGALISETFDSFPGNKNVQAEILQDDIDSMARDYIRGVFDDDMEIDGPVVNTLDDFEYLNSQLPETKSTAKDSSLKGLTQNKPQDDPELNEIEPAYDDSSDSDVMADSIVERELDDFNSSEDNSGFQTSDHVQQSILEQEISENYYALKNKLSRNQIRVSTSDL